MLGAIFVVIVVFMPEGLVPGTAHLTRLLQLRRGSADRSTGSTISLTT